MKKNKKGFASRPVVMFIGLLVACVIGVEVYGYTVSRKVDSSGSQIYLLEDSGNVTIAGTVTSAGAQTITSGGLTVTAGGATITAGGLSVTDGGATVTSGIINLGSWSETLAEAAVITNQAGLGVLTGTSGGTTNTIANPAVVGDILKLVNISANPIVLVENTNLQIAGNITLGQWDSIELIGATTTNWTETSRSNN